MTVSFVLEGHQEFNFERLILDDFQTIKWQFLKTIACRCLKFKGKAYTTDIKLAVEM